MEYTVSCCSGRPSKIPEITDLIFLAEESYTPLKTHGVSLQSLRLNPIFNGNSEKVQPNKERPHCHL